MATFVIVHGAWAGSWGWQRVTDRLHALGHRVFAPTLTGLGERSHLAHCDVTLDTHIADVVNEITFKDLTDLVLVVHSYGGFVGNGVVERVGDRVAAMVFAEAFIPEDGQSFTDLSPGWNPTEDLIPAPVSSIGDYLDDADVEMVNAKATPQPVGTFRQKAKSTGAYLRVARKMFIEATGWDGAFTETAKKLEADPAWDVRRLACGHDIALDLPDEVTKILIAAAPAT